MMEFNVDVDASGLMCPLPLLRLKKALMSINSGEVIRIIATDPAAHLDFGVYIEQAGHALVYSSKQTDTHIFYIQKK